MRPCVQCGSLLNLEDFPCSTNCRTFKKYPTARCRDCKNKNQRTVQALKKIFPAPPEGRCDLCKKQRPLCIDHDHHKTGVSSFRGHLCRSCNTSACRYSIDELLDTIEYLRRAERRSRELCSCDFDSDSTGVNSSYENSIN